MAGTPNVVRSVLDRRTTLENRIGLLSDLAEDVLGRASVSENDLDRVRAVLSEIEEDLSELIKVKKTDGFFREILSASPESQHTVDQLMEDYYSLHSDMQRLRTELSDFDHWPTARRLLHGWVTRFRELDSREIGLLQKVWNVDVGATD